MFLRITIVLCAGLAIVPAVDASEKDVPAAIGWRGNLTGLFPDSKAPVEWSLVSTGPAEGMKCAANVPGDGSDKDVVSVDGGLVTKWLVIGPLAVKDGTADFGKELIPGEASLSPEPGDKVGDLRWKPAEPASEGVSFMTVNTTGAKGKTNEGALATTCLFTRTAGKLRAVAEHPVQMKMFVNGKEVYRNEKYGVAVGSAYGLSNNRCESVWPAGNSFEFVVRQGWNRLTVKLVSTPRAGWNDLIFMLRLGDANYVAMPVAASCTLIGEHVVVMDNQGHSVVLEPGGECKEVARNRIAMQVQRDWATTTQEYTAYAPPVAEGNRMYIRGERHLYCIGSN